VKRLAVALACVLGIRAAAANPAPGGVWAQASESADDELARVSYDEAMLAGDDHVSLAVKERGMQTRRRMVERAAASYETASRARPAAAEPHFRAAAVLDAFLVDCRRDEAPLCRDDSEVGRDVGERIIAHWDAFTRLAPLDPRVTDEVLLDRAILHTKLATEAHWIAATADYEEVLHRMRDDARTDAIFSMRGRRAMVLGNLAETYMMLGDLDRAIETYRASLRFDPDTSRMFGLAVALDRDEQRAEAWRVLQLQGGDALGDLVRDIVSRRVFFVPEGEAEYYLALGAEWSGDDVAAIEHYEAFLVSKAHPRFALRARTNIARLKAKPLRLRGRDRAGWVR